MVANKYELMFILVPDLTEEAQETYLQRVQGYLAEAEATVFSFKEWGLRRLAYPIKGYHEGRYYLAHFSMDTQRLGRFEQSLQFLAEGVLREMVTRLESDAEMTDAPPAKPSKLPTFTEDTGRNDYRSDEADFEED
ncbi:MAG: 30S ribosomal protein S6 [Anaerolineae bacterium]|nr:30S ribosomal protein S6 [Anaerolineae bacterium]